MVQMYVEDTVLACMDSITHLFLVSRPVAGFTTDTTAGCVPLTVNFTDTTSLAASWLWDFGDGSTDTLPNPSHQYTTPGNYDVQLIVAYANGCADTAFFPALIAVHDVTVDFATASTLLCTGVPNAFTDLSVGTSAVSTWLWTFGDGNSSNLANPSNAYANGGLYSVGLTVTDINGCIDSILRPDLALVLEPVAAFSLSNSTLCPGEMLQLANQSTGSGLTSSWNFGDGNSSNIPSPGHAYLLTGTYPINLIVTDSAGCQDTAMQTMQVANPIAAFSVSDSVRSCPPLLVNFTNNSIGNIASYAWDFGDGNSSQLNNPSHVYTTPGNYDVTLIVTTPSGCTDTLLFPNRIGLSGPFATISASKDTICRGDTVSLVATGSQSAGITWILGDGNISTGSMSVQHGYQTSGSFLPTLVLQDSLGCTVFLFASDSIRVLQPPTPGFAVSTPELCDPGTVNFTDQSQYFSPIGVWNWSFGDGGSSNQQNPGHFYAAPGVYDVSLALTDSMGCSSDLLIPASVVVHAQTALFTPDTTSGCIPLVVSFLDNSFADTTIVSWSWTYGDGTTGSGPGGMHTYIDTGYFDLSLAIATAAGCTDTLTISGGIYTYSPANTAAPDLVVATVVNNAEIDLNWTLPTFRGAGEVVVERSSDGVSWSNLATLSPGVNQYRDANVDVIANSYYYQVNLTDSCGGISPLSRSARSVLLQINDQTGTGQLSWNGYVDWVAGVDRYEIEARDQDDTNWQNIGTVSGGQTFFTDESLSDFDGGRCYRVSAYESNGNLASSLSNEACGRSELWVPNTITPNGDGANDFLVIPALTGFPGSSIEIFNRWGGQVYASADYQNDWDGVHQSTGEALPDGTYFYILRLSDAVQVFKGYTTIMR
jgi:gliding motility-associated-like protein